MKLALTYVDEIFEFAGLWDAPSMCGLKIQKRPDRHLVIATELWDKNPGTSITNFCAQLADLVCEKFELDRDKLLFIEHCPETGSHLEIYSETFHRVTFDRVDGTLRNPDWTGMTRQEVDGLLSAG